ncbi:hypothetical protein HYALB_00012602 [Hymenoscyphus albidus]|uniref:PhnB-like domain-containing protein n=1 Tax=Hymenoscyphus albidus TaxID=595503 RepID=A0A9N9Q3K9_9HELO|nr:hypothetical protein HYALB_00012602 [Hymenoscyphus albidus]
MNLCSKITPCIWFDGHAHEAATFYTSIFPNSKMTHIQHYTSTGSQTHQHPPGTIMTVASELNGQSFTALNGGPHFQFTPAVSFQIMCEDQAQVDHYWEKLSEGGPIEAQQCGWVADKFGVSWQVVPRVLLEMLADEDGEKAGRATEVMMGMKKLDVEGLRKAFDGEGA